MSEIIDVMHLIPDDAPEFTPDTTGAVLSVDLKQPAGHSDPFLFGAAGKYHLQAGDNFIVLSAGYVLPESFCMAQVAAGLNQNCPSLSVGLQKTTGGAIYFIPNFLAGGMVLPLENYELPLGVFVNAGQTNASLLTANFNIVAVWNKILTFWPQVSMIGAPGVLNGVKQRITLFIKILHNKPLL